MNEELVLAIEELRRRPADRVWFIPVLLGPCEVPDRAIGAGETLRSLHWVNLHEDWPAGVRSIISTLAPASTGRPERFVNPADGSAMILVHGGEHLWGDAGAVEKMDIPDFYIGEYPVTNAQYRRFLAAMLPEDGAQCAAANTTLTWLQTDRQGRKTPMPEDFWIGGLSYGCAQAYCAWASLRLPTLFELEYYVFAVQRSKRNVMGINIGYNNLLPFYWTSTLGKEIGKGADNHSPIASPVNMGMHRGVAIPFAGGPGVPAPLDFGLRPAAGVDILSRQSAAAPAT